ncbi:GNAT family N-acetyltransferase [Streptomyces sp. NBC_01304]|uniref:GNAT family N-acetyltransferase n=1 Tax=Streptomyces sp. NBC_01304 TaxID=2903818 RepID=UPI002E13FC72|nr:GNAT family N-acetyltransferase [Streptomyces sp. NBC_01304]
MPHGDLPVRPACMWDGPALTALERAGWSWLSEVAPQRTEGAAVFDEQCRAEGFPVAELASEAVGYIRQVPATPPASNQHVRQIRGLQVSNDLRGHGVGKTLVEAACAAARVQGARRMSLRVLGHNVPARRLSERCGFRIEGVQPGEFLLGDSSTP